MDASHILLGHIWKFDRKIVHHGNTNTYSFKVGKKKILPKPMIEDFILKKGNLCPTSLLNLSEFVQEIKEYGVIYVLVGLKDSRAQVFLMVVKGLLEEFKDVVPVELLE